MRTFDVQTIELPVPLWKAFHYISNPATLPEWTHAFTAADHEQATMTTPQGTVQVGLRVNASEEHGTIDWTMTFADGATAHARSRLVANGTSTIYTFVLKAPPAPLEQLEGALAEQSRILADELTTLAGNDCRSDETTAYGEPPRIDLPASLPTAIRLSPGPPPEPDFRRRVDCDTGQNDRSESDSWRGVRYDIQTRGSDHCQERRHQRQQLPHL